MKRSWLWGALASIVLSATAAQAVAAPCTLNKYADLPVTMVGLRPTISARINGQDVRFLVDSGAFFSLMSSSAVLKLGLRMRDLPGQMTVRGVAGQVDARVTSVKEFQVGPFDLPSVDFITDPGPLFSSDLSNGIIGALGQNFLRQFEVEYDFANGVIRLFSPKGDCAKVARAYWATDFSTVELESVTASEPHLIGRVTVNGQKLRATFDTGAATSVLTVRAGARVGITPSSPGVFAAGLGAGGGTRRLNAWNAPVAKFEVGGESISNTHLMMSDIDLSGQSDLLVGADFFLAHRVYVATGEHKIYLTYNGGPIFSLGVPGAPAVPPPAAPPTSAGGASTIAAFDRPPTDAGGFSRRGAAFAARRDWPHAIADFSRAAELEPTNPRHFLDRARARLANRDGILAMADLDEAIRLKPDQPEALMTRGSLYLELKDEGRARGDFEAAMRLAPADSPTRLAVAGAYERARLFETSLTHFDRWIADHPKDLRMDDALNGRCWVRAEWGQQLELGLADCDAALKLRPRTASFLDSRGLVRFRLGQVDEAIADYNAALAIQPKLPWSLYGRGLARLKKGMKAQGEADIAAALALDANLQTRAVQIGLAAPVVTTPG